jgi:hypothetical protein
MFPASRIVLAVVLASAVAGAPRVADAGGAACPGYEGLIYCGELSGDCKITANDALFALRMSVDQLPPSEAADLDHSFTVTAGDALRILRISVGSVESLLGCGATQYSVKATNVGYYVSDGTAAADNYATGWYDAPYDDESRSYFVFDVSGIPGTVLGAKLHLASAPDGYIVLKSPDPTETVTVFDVDTPLPTLTGGTGGTSAFADLGDGDVYGTFVATENTGYLVNIELNSDAENYIDSATGKVVFGVAITTLAKGVGDEFIFNSTHITNVRELVLTVAQ